MAVSIITVKVPGIQGPIGPAGPAGEGFSGYTGIPITGNYTITALSPEYEDAIWAFTGTLTTYATITAPLTLGLLRLVKNLTTAALGGYRLVFGGATGKQVVVENGEAAVLYCDGTDWIHVNRSGKFSVEDFGAKPEDSTVDSSVGFNAAITAATTLTGVTAGTWGGLVEFESKGGYWLRNSINIIDNTANGNCRAITLVGRNAGNSGGARTSSLIWDSATTTAPAIALYSRDCTIENISITAASGRTLYCGVEITEAIGAGHGTCTANTLRNVRVDPEGIGGSITHGFSLGDNLASRGNPTFPNNCENMMFSNCLAHLCTGNGFHGPSSVAQSKNLTFLKGAYYANGGSGIYLESGGFCAIETTVGHNAVAGFKGTNWESATIISVQSENDARLLDFNNAAAICCPITIINGRARCPTTTETLPTPSLPGDHQHIKCVGARLEIINLEYDPVYNADMLIGNRAPSDGTNHIGATTDAVHCQFPNEAPFTNDTGTQLHTVWARASHGINSSGQPVLIEGWNGKALTTSGTVTLKEYLFNIKGLSTTGVQAKNVTGTITIADANTTGAVTFAVAEPDTSYQIFYSLDTVASAPAATGNIWTSSKATSGFTINLTTAPGGGKSVTVRWLLIRA